MLPIQSVFSIEIILLAPRMLRTMLELTKTQRANILAGLANIDYRTVTEYLNGKTVSDRKRESIELAERTLTQMLADHEEACARRKLAFVDSSDTTKGTEHGRE